MRQTVTVSVVMAMRNAEATIAQSMQSLLDQSFTDWELILIDDGSSDTSVEVARRFVDPRIAIYVDGQSLGLAARLNEAVALTHGPLIARMDADDIAYPERFSRQVAFLDLHPEVDLLGTGAIVFANDGQVVGALPIHSLHQQIAARPWAGFYLAHPTWMGRRDWFIAHRYDVRAIKSQDYDLLLRTYETSRFACLPEILLGYRQEQLSLKKILSTRIQTSQAIVRHGWRQRKLHMMVIAVAGQIAKLGIDTLAISTGLSYRILRHRALVVSPENCGIWQQLWQRINQEVGIKCAA